MAWVWGMVLGNKNRTAVCGDWNQEKISLVRAKGVENEIWYGPDSTGMREDGYGSPNQQAYMTGDGMKLLGCNNYDGQAVRYFLYNLTRDPQERHDLSSEMPMIAASMESGLQAWMASVKRSMGPAESNCLGPHPWGPPA